MNVTGVAIRNCNLILTVTDSDKDLFPTLEVVAEEDGWKFHYGEKDGVVRLGLEAPDGNKPGHGGLWSSSHEGAMYYHKKEVVPVSIRVAEGYLMGAYLTKEEFMKHMPVGYRLVSGYKVMKVFSRNAKLTREVAFV